MGSYTNPERGEPDSSERQTGEQERATLGGIRSIIQYRGGFKSFGHGRHGLLHPIQSCRQVHDSRSGSSGFSWAMSIRS
jgi:hypothetical protein